MWGAADQAADKPIKADTIFRIYSMSKPVTSVAVMMLVEQGKIDLDVPVSEYLPELSNLKVLVVEGEGDDRKFKEVDAKRPTTARDLLRHTSGLTYGFFGSSEVDKRYLAAGILYENTVAETVTKLSKLPLKHQPGTRFEYSVSTDVLGRLVEVASGERFDRFLRTHIFAPLGMRDAFFNVPIEKLDRLAEMYAPDGNGLKPAAAQRSRRLVNPDNRFFSGGGGLCCTTRDDLRFCQMLLNGGMLDGKRIINSETIAEMTKNQLGEEVRGRGGFQFGLGFAISDRGVYSWGGAAGTRFWIDPVNQFIGIFMIQINPYGGRNYGDQMKTIVYRALDGDKP